MNRRLALLFLLALLGTLAVVGIALAQLGWPVLVAYLAVVVVGLGLLARQARRIRAKEQRAQDGRTCSCCTSTVFDPVEVV